MLANVIYAKHVSYSVYQGWYSIKMRGGFVEQSSKCVRIVIYLARESNKCYRITFRTRSDLITNDPLPT